MCSEYLLNIAEKHHLPNHTRPKRRDYRRHQGQELYEQLGNAELEEKPPRASGSVRQNSRWLVVALIRRIAAIAAVGFVAACPPGFDVLYLEVDLGELLVELVREVL